MKQNHLTEDLKASIVVFLVALPLCLGIALASNAPLSSGLIAGIIGGIVVGFFSHSEVSVSGPAAGLTVIVASGIAQVGGYQIFCLSVMGAGIFQIIFGIFKGGAIGDYFPTAVIKGMLAAIGCILIIKQLPNALGLTGGYSSFPAFDKGILTISLVSLAIMLSWDNLASKGHKLFKMVPGALVAVVVSIILNKLFALVGPLSLVTLPATIFSDLNLPAFGKLSYPVVSVAFTIAVVASLETLLCIDAADKMDPQKRKTNKNRELLAQGIGNSLSGLIGGLPITAVIVRTSANVASGARSKYSSIFHGGWLFLCVLLIPGLLNMIPLATLACVLLLVGYKLTKPAFFVEMKKRGWVQLFIFCTTIGVILATDLLIGIFTGLGVALLFELNRPALNCVEVEHLGDQVHLKFTRNVSFLHKAKVSKLLNDMPEGKKIHIHGYSLVRVHIDVHELVTAFHAEASKRDMEIIFK